MFLIHVLCLVLLLYDVFDPFKGRIEEREHVVVGKESDVCSDYKYHKQNTAHGFGDEDKHDQSFDRDKAHIENDELGYVLAWCFELFQTLPEYWIPAVEPQIHQILLNVWHKHKA